MRCIADIAGLDFKQVCHAGVGKAWESIIYGMIQNGECQIPAMVGIEKRKYSGALVLEPEPKSYTASIEIFDVKGLYPTVMILHNLSFETVCCDCCKDDPTARVPQSIMDSINNSLGSKIKSQAVYEKEKRKERYWICIKNKGAIPKVCPKLSDSLKRLYPMLYEKLDTNKVKRFEDWVKDNPTDNNIYENCSHEWKERNIFRCGTFYECVHCRCHKLKELPTEEK